MKWIHISDKLPPHRTEVLMRVKCCEHFNVEQGQYLGAGVWVNCWCASRYPDHYPVTHWMPLPDPPKEHRTTPVISKQTTASS